MCVHRGKPCEEVVGRVGGCQLRRQVSNQTYQHLDLGLPASGTVRKQISVG